MEALKGKKELLQKWEDDKDKRIKNFVIEFKSNLDKQILFWEKRADEEVIDKKLEFGENIDVENNE